MDKTCRYEYIIKGVFRRRRDGVILIDIPHVAMRYSIRRVPRPVIARHLFAELRRNGIEGLIVASLRGVELAH